MIAIVAPPARHDLISTRLTNHFQKLEATGFVGAPVFHAVGDVLLTYDGSSPFAEFEKELDCFSLYTGFRNADPTAQAVDSYAGIVLESSSGTGRLRTDSDPLYPWPLYYATNDGAAAIGNDVHALAIALNLTELDAEAVTELITFQYVLGRSTTVKGINRIWPNEILLCPASAQDLPDVLTPNLVGVRPDYTTNPQFDLDTHVDQTFASLVSAIPSYPIEDQDTVVQLSGGLDSRLTAVAIKNAGITDVNCITMNLEDGEEIIIAREITERFGFKHEVLELPAGGRQDLDVAWLLTGGQAPLHAAANNIPYYRSQLHGRELVRIVGAWPADLLIGALVPKFSDFANPRAVDAALRYWIAEFTDNQGARELFKHSPRAKKHVKLTRKRIKKQVSEPHGTTAAQRISHWAFNHCAPVFTFLSPSRLTSKVLELAPVMAPKFVENLLALRGEDLLQRNFYQRMIWKAAPELRDIPYHNTGKLLTPDYDTSLQPMSWKLRLLLRLPSFVYQTVTSAHNKKVLRSHGQQLSVQSTHWHDLFTAEVNRPFDLAPGLRVDPRVVENHFARVGISATVLACEWTRDYLQRFNLDELSSAKSSNPGRQES